MLDVVSQMERTSNLERSESEDTENNDNTINRGNAPGLKIVTLQEMTDYESSSPQMDFCTCVGVDPILLDRLNRKSRSNSTMEIDDGCVEVLRKIQARGKGTRSLSHVCYRHLQIIGARIGLQTQGSQKNELERRLLVCFDNKGSLSRFKTASKTSSWFRLEGRPEVIKDQLGVFRLFPRIQSLTQPLNLCQAQQVVEDFMGEDAWATWERDGNVIVKNLFSWLWDGVAVGEIHGEGVGKRIDLKFDL